MIIGSLFLGGWAFAAVLIISGSIALYEFYTLGQRDVNVRVIIPALAGSILILTVSYFVFAGLLHQDYLSGGFIVLICFLAYSLFAGSKFNVIQQVFGLVYVTLPLVLTLSLVFPSVSGYSYTHRIVLGILILIWVNDTGAYITGITAGKNPLFQRISPKKTWEGAAGGSLLTIIAALFMKGIMDMLQTSDWIIIAVIVSVFGVIGDLFESMLKRNAGVKDSGNIIPGHGGVLDRIDSMLFVIPVVFVYLKICNF